MSFLASRLIRLQNAVTRCPEVLFYSDDVVFLESVITLSEPPEVGNAAVVFATKPHRDYAV